MQKKGTMNVQQTVNVKNKIEKGYFINCRIYFSMWIDNVEIIFITHSIE